jgi:putative transcriptional regulator
MIALAVLLIPMRSTAQSEPRIPKTPYLLVATVGMPDPMFEQSVILMLTSPSNSPIIDGVIINKPTDVTWGRLFRGAGELRQAQQKVYFGGPVSFDEPLLFIRGGQSVKGATRVMGNLYANVDTGQIVATLKDAHSPGDLRLYLGRAQWTPDQLKGEIREGAWEIKPAQVDAVFRPDPTGLWQELAHPEHLREVRWSGGDAHPASLSSAATFNLSF